MIRNERDLLVFQLSAEVAPLIAVALGTHPEHPSIDYHPLLIALRTELQRGGRIRTTAEAQALNDHLLVGALAADIDNVWTTFESEKTEPASAQLAKVINTVGRWFPDSTLVTALHTYEVRRTPPS